MNSAFGIVQPCTVQKDNLILWSALPLPSMLKLGGSPQSHERSSTLRFSHGIFPICRIGDCLGRYFWKEAHLYKAFGTVQHGIFVSKMMRRGFDRRTTRWVRNWLGGHVQRVVVTNGSMSRERSVKRGVPPWSVLGLVTFNILVGNNEMNLLLQLDDLVPLQAASWQCFLYFNHML